MDKFDHRFAKISESIDDIKQELIDIYRELPKECFNAEIHDRLGRARFTLEATGNYIDGAWADIHQYFLSHCAGRLMTGSSQESGIRS
ncbi:MAG: hypothetical protein FWH27_13750 [Planctomycetaceae bacterium]|nr:hypothetical protein [Planctomycetaceae bacterium]